MSYTRKTKNGYYGIAEFRTSDGKRHQKSAGLFKLKREAQQAGVDLEKELDQRNMNLADISLLDYFKRWFDLYKKDKAQSASAQNQYRIMTKYIAEYWQETKLADVRRSDYQRFINWYGANHAYKSVSKLNGAVRSAVGYAIDDDIITKDFTHNVNVTYNRDRKNRVEYLTTKELNELKTAVMDKLDHHNTSRYMILLAIFTGMRKSEIQALTWKDIDFIHSTISVNKSWDKRKRLLNQLKPHQASEPLK